MMVTPKQLNKAGVSPLLCLVWLYMLLYTAVFFVGIGVLLTLDSVIKAVAIWKFSSGYPLFQSSLLTLKECLTFALKADAIFYFTVYVLFVAFKRKTKKEAE